jgi:predicted ATPase
MILFLAGTPGIGKSSLTAALQAAYQPTAHLEVDRFRKELGTQDTIHASVEDALNWRIYVAAVDLSRKWSTQSHLIVIDSTGISKRLPYLRFALGDYEQKMVRLWSAYPFAMCARKWGSDYSQEKLDHIQKMVMSLRTDIDVCVDGKSATALATDLLGQLGLA